MPEATFTVTVFKDTDELSATELSKADIEFGKEKIASIEYKSEMVVRMNDEEGYIPFAVKNQYGEDITNTALGRGVQFITSTNQTAEIDYKAGLLVLKHTGGAMNQLKDLKTVVVTARDTSTGFVQTNTFSVSETVGAITDVNLLGIVDEKGNAVDFVFDTSKTYYLDYEAYDINGNKTTYLKALTAKLFTKPILEVISTNTNLVQVVAEAHPDDSTRLAFRLVIQGLTLQYDTPITFIAVTPFSAKNATYNATLLRKGRVETFALQTPAETASVNKAIEIPFTASDQNGNPVTKFDDLQGIVQFSTNDVKFSKQPDGSAKLYGVFATDGQKYITATVTGSLTGSFSQISIDVKSKAVPSSIEAIRHADAYTSTSAMEKELKDFVVRDQYDRVMNFSNDPATNDYRILVMSSNKDILGIDGGTEDGNVVYKIIGAAAGDKVKFVGGTTNGTATVTYKLVTATYDYGTNTPAPIDSATAIAYNVPVTDIKSVEITASTKDLYMIRGDNKYIDGTGKLTDLGKELGFEIKLKGKTAGGMNVILPTTLTPYYTITNGKFSLGNAGTLGGAANKVYAVGDFGNASTATTEVTGYVNSPSGVLSATTTLTANSAAPVVASVEVAYDAAALKADKISVTNNVVKVNDKTLLDDQSVLKYKADGSKNSTAITFVAKTQYGDFVLEKVVLTKTFDGAGPDDVKIDEATGVISDASAAEWTTDKYTLTAIAINGKTMTIVLEP